MLRENVPGRAKNNGKSLRLRVSLKCFKNNGKVIVAEAERVREGAVACDEFRKMVMVVGDEEGEIGASILNDFYLDSYGSH